MLPINNLDDAQTILLATRLVTESNFSQLQLLAAEQKHILLPKLLYRQLLTYLPADVESIPNLIVFLKHLESDFKDVSNLDGILDQSDSQDVSSRESRRRLHALRLHEEQSRELDKYGDELSAFIVIWLREVESLCGLSPSILQLPQAFLQNRPKLQSWYDSYLLPLIKLQTEFYPGRAELLSTQSLESMGGVVGIKSLLQFAEQDGGIKAQIGRDLEEVVTPWVHGASKAKRRRVSQPDTVVPGTSWQDVNEWILASSHSDFHLAAKSFLQWNGPPNAPSQNDDLTVSEISQDIFRYVQTGLALIATSKETGEDTNVLLRQVLDRAISISATIAEVSTSSAKQALFEASKSDLLANTVLLPANPITYPSENTFNLFDHCLSAQRILERFKISLPIVTVVDVALFGSEDRQKQEVLRILQQVPRLTRTEIDWPRVRQHLFFLQSGKDEQLPSAPSNEDSLAFLRRMPRQQLESEFLDALIANGQYTTINEIYLDSTEPPLDRSLVQEHIVSAIYEAYDNASNGNRTRGGMKRAYDLLKAFQPKFVAATVFTYIDYLIRATHSLSFYQVTLQHGVPFQPATIRIHHDPVALLEKVLAQNHKAFTKLDDLLEIAHNLVQAHLPNAADAAWSSKSLDERLFDTQHRITYLAITSALSDHDFDTAYSYITTRLATSPSQTLESPFTDDTSWRAAYAAGKYRPLSSPKSLHDRITGLSKRMDLLSLALTLTPTPDSLSEILATWRRCEEEMESLRSQALQEERMIDNKTYGYSTLPGGFAEDREMDAAETRRMMERRALGGTGPSYEDEAPMGLFDVARGAASAFRKSAFPLRGAGAQVKIRDPAIDDDGSGRDSFDERGIGSEQQRVRKRDMVSNMVTGGLVSGMSWVLGAPTPRQDEDR